MFLYCCRRTILFLWHLYYLIISYARLLIQQFRILFSNHRKLENCIQNEKLIPANLGIIIDNYHQNLDEKIIETVDFLSEIQQVEYIAVYFTSDSVPLSFKSPKVTVLAHKHNDAAFLETMKSNRPLEDCHYPFPSRLDLAVFFTDFPHLCSFFTWTLDLTTFYFAGPSSNISPLTILDSFDSFNNAEQRCGK